MKHRKGDVFLPKFQITCPWCAGTVMAGYCKGDPAVTHTKPTCETFMVESPATYLRRVREHYESTS